MVVKITDELIKEKLSRDESRELLILIRKEAIPPILFLGDRPSLIEYFENLQTNFQNYTEKDYKIYGKTIEMVKDKLRIKELYERVSPDLYGCMIHWNLSWNDQKKKNQEYNSMKKLPKQDNKTYLSERKSGYRSNANKIRYPKKNRKTAWKRFYRLFPHLNPKLNEDLTNKT